jgi:hypothetical protein
MIESMIVSKAVQGIMNLIDNQKKQYYTEYSYQIKNGDFYDQISINGPFDPTGIRFKGFTVARTFQTKKNAIDTSMRGKMDTGFLASFSIDTSQNSMIEILNNGIFRLRLDSLYLNQARVKVPEKERTLNMDFEINFYATFVGINGQINTDVLLGRFIYSIRNAPLDKSDKDYVNYYNDLRKTDCVGQSFLIPRSSGYYKKKVREGVYSLEKCFGQGLYSISVNVKESSKNNFVDKMIFTGANDIITIGNATLENKFGVAPATPIHN